MNTKMLLVSFIRGDELAAEVELSHGSRCKPTSLLHAANAPTYRKSPHQLWRVHTVQTEIQRKNVIHQEK